MLDKNKIEDDKEKPTRGKGWYAISLGLGLFALNYLIFIFTGFFDLMFVIISGIVVFLGIATVINPEIINAKIWKNHNIIGSFFILVICVLVAIIWYYLIF